MSQGAKYIQERTMTLKRTTRKPGTAEYVDEQETVTVGLEIDVDYLFRSLGHKAFRNKTGVATEVGGAVKVRIIR